jgi:glycosyltransferase involved in cell wall biosynthesis
VRSLPAELPVSLSLYGRGCDFPAYFERLQQLAAGDPRIRFCGTFPNDVIAQIFSTIDVLAVPSIWYENTPLVIYSAQAAHCPVIASNLGGMAEIVQHEENGLLFEPGSVAGIAGSIERLASDRGLLQRLSINAVPPKGIAEYADELDKLYRLLLSERGES